MILVTGPSCSGKTTFGRIARGDGFDVMETTDVVKQDFKEKRLQEEDIIDFCKRRYSEGSEEIFARRNHSRIVQAGYDVSRLVCVGLRAAGEVTYFRSAFPDVKVIGIYADASIRFERGLVRQRDDCAKRFEDFIRRDMREYAMGLAALLASTLDVLICNNGSMQDFETAVRRELPSIV